MGSKRDPVIVHSVSDGKIVLDYTLSTGMRECLESAMGQLSQDGDERLEFGAERGKVIVSATTKCEIPYANLRPGLHGVAFVSVVREEGAPGLIALVLDDIGEKDATIDDVMEVVKRLEAKLNQLISTIGK